MGVQTITAIHSSQGTQSKNICKLFTISTPHFE